LPVAPHRSNGTASARARSVGPAAGWAQPLWVGGEEAGSVFRPGKSTDLFMVGFLHRRFGAPNLESVLVLEDPFQRFTFFHFQSAGQGRRTDEIILAVVAALDDMEFCGVTHECLLAS